jgi:hypothetical protein
VELTAFLLMNFVVVETFTMAIARALSGRSTAQGEAVIVSVHELIVALMVIAE